MLRLKYCDNLKCNKSPLEIQKGITIRQEGKTFHIPDVEIEVCPICGTEYHNYEAMEKISKVIYGE